MKILMLISSYYPELGGAEIFAREIAERSVREGNEVDVIPALWDKSLKQFEIINGVNVYRLKLFKGKSPPRYLFNFRYIVAAARKALKLNSVRHYDLIHSVMEYSGGVAGTIVKKLTGKPHLVTLQGGTFLERASLFRKVSIGMVEKWCLRNADLVHGISNHLIEQRVKRFGARATVVIPNGVDMQRFYPGNKQQLKEKRGFSPGSRIVLSICPGLFGGSPSTPAEGYLALIESLASLSRDFPDLQLVIIAEGYKRELFKSLAKRLGVEDRLSLLGSIPHEQLPGYFGLADVFIRPRTVEGQGISYIEAMACGVPVVGANVGGTLDVIEHGENGLLVSPQSVEEISQAIRLLLEDEALRNRFIQQGLKTVEQKFRWEAAFHRINQIYTALLEARR